MNILFLNANLYGHINPTLGLVKKLTDRKNQVDYFCSEAFSKAVTDAGADWIGYSDNVEQFFKDFHPTDRHPFYMLMEYTLLYTETALPVFLELIRKKSYDMIICDSYFGGACFLKQLVQIPVICSHSSFAMSSTPVPDRMLQPGFHPQLDYCNQILQHICDTYHIETPSLAQVFTSKGERNIVYTTCRFNADAEVHEPEYLFAGPSLDRLQGERSIDLSVVKKRKLIYISLGSVNTDFLAFYQMCISAFRDTDYYVCMSIGNKLTTEQLGDLPSNFTIKNFLPQLEVLEQADIFITHAGFNSVSEAIYFGVPMLALPQVNDQFMVAKKISSLQLGITENIKELSYHLLRDKVESLMADTEIKENCLKMSREMKESTKLEQVVMKLEQYAAAYERESA